MVIICTTVCSANKPNIFTRCTICVSYDPHKWHLSVPLHIVYQSVLIIESECVLCAVETEMLNSNFDKFQYTTPSHGSGGYSHVSQTRGHGFEPGAIRVGFMADKVPLGKVFLRVLPFTPSVLFRKCSIFFFHLKIMLPFGQPGQSLGTFNNAVSFR